MKPQPSFHWWYPRKVQYYETDKMAIVHHANYVRWLEEARLEYGSLHDISYEQMEAEGIMMPVLEVNCRYRTPMEFGQTAQVYTRMAAFNGVRVKYEYEIFCLETGALVLQGYSWHCFVDAESRRPLNLKTHHPKFYQLSVQLLELESDMEKEQNQ
ncbi:MAG: acyl-CoA thioesterase [Oscillospiraceae bacterium]|nr:acyl-CoA thioesterase [Oscillospiraceae bacterium]